MCGELLNNDERALPPTRGGVEVEIVEVPGCLYGVTWEYSAEYLRSRSNHLGWLTYTVLYSNTVQYNTADTLNRQALS